MLYNSVDQLRQRLSEEMPGFDAISDDALLKAWIWDAMKIIDSDRLFEEAQAVIKVVKGKGQLPPDYFGVWSIPFGCSLRPGQRQLTARSDGDYQLGYWAIPVDDEGFPLIPDIAETAIIAYIDFKFTALQQKKRQLSNPAGYRIDNNMNQYNEQRAVTMLVGVRGEVNMLSIEESVALINYRQSYTTYRN